MNDREQGSGSRDQTAETAFLLLAFMNVIGKAALAGDAVAQPYLDADAVRIVDGNAEFHKERFLALLAKQIVEEP